MISFLLESPVRDFQIKKHPRLGMDYIAGNYNSSSE